MAKEKFVNPIKVKLDTPAGDSDALEEPSKTEKFDNTIRTGLNPDFVKKLEGMTKTKEEKRKELQEKISKLEEDIEGKKEKLQNPRFRGRWKMEESLLERREQLGKLQKQLNELLPPEDKSSERPPEGREEEKWEMPEGAAGVPLPTIGVFPKPQKTKKDKEEDEYQRIIKESQKRKEREEMDWKMSGMAGEAVGRAVDPTYQKKIEIKPGEEIEAEVIFKNGKPWLKLDGITIYPSSGGFTREEAEALKKLKPGDKVRVKLDEAYKPSGPSGKISPTGKEYEHHSGTIISIPVKIEKLEEEEVEEEIKPPAKRTFVSQNRADFLEARPREHAPGILAKESVLEDALEYRERFKALETKKKMKKEREKIMKERSELLDEYKESKRGADEIQTSSEKPVEEQGTEETIISETEETEEEKQLKSEVRNEAMKYLREKKGLSEEKAEAALTPERIQKLVKLAQEKQKI